MNKVGANIVKGIFGRLKSKKRDRKNSLSWLKHKIIKHQDDQQIKKASFRNFSVFYKRPYELLHTYKDIFVEEIYKFDTKESEPLIIDCGSNIGISVLYFKKIYPGAIVHSFEPDENNFELLCKNVAENKLEKVQVHKAAVWVNNGTIYFESKATESSHILETTNEHSIEVKSIRLANVLQAHNKIHFLKIDIEGAEWEVLKDCAGALNHVENLFLEYHGKATETQKLASVFSLLENAGFSIYIKNAADNLQHPFTQKRTESIYDVQLNLFCYR